jgi:hypothetical protein
MDTAWIEEMLRLNTRIIAAEVSIGIQTRYIADLIEEGRETADRERWLMAFRKNLRSLRQSRNDMLEGIGDKGDVGPD